MVFFSAATENFPTNHFSLIAVIAVFVLTQNFIRIRWNGVPQEAILSPVSPTLKIFNLWCSTPFLYKQPLLLTIQPFYLKGPTPDSNLRVENQIFSFGVQTAFVGYRNFALS
jgi:hypothetical protein